MLYLWFQTASFTSKELGSAESSQSHVNEWYSLSRTLLIYRWVWLLDDSIQTRSHDLYSNTFGYGVKNDWSSYTESFEIIYVITSFEFLLGLVTCVCIPGYHKFIPCMFNGDLQRKPPENFGKHLQMKTNLWYIVLGGRVGFKKVWSKLLQNWGRSFYFGFSCQPTAGLGATKKRQVGTIIRASSKFHGPR